MFRLGDVVSQMGDKFFVLTALVIFVSIFIGVLLYAFLLRRETIDAYAQMPLQDALLLVPKVEEKVDKPSSDRLDLSTNEKVSESKSEEIHEPN